MRFTERIGLGTRFDGFEFESNIARSRRASVLYQTIIKRKCKPFYKTENGSGIPGGAVRNASAQQLAGVEQAPDARRRRLVGHDRTQHACIRDAHDVTDNHARTTHVVKPIAHKCDNVLSAECRRYRRARPSAAQRHRTPTSISAFARASAYEKTTRCLFSTSLRSGDNVAPVSRVRATQRDLFVIDR